MNRPKSWWKSNKNLGSPPTLLMPMPEIKHFFYGRCSLSLCVVVNPPTGSCPSRACRSWDLERRHPSFCPLTTIWNERKKYLEFWGSGINLKKSSVWIGSERTRMPSISSSLYSKAKATSIGLILTSVDLFYLCWLSRAQPNLTLMPDQLSGRYLIQFP